VEPLIVLLFEELSLDRTRSFRHAEPALDGPTTALLVIRR
jgi:hypothetical protein